MRPAERLPAPEPDLAGVAALIGDPTRAAMLLALFDGAALPASELAYRAGASPQAASLHLARLVAGGLLSVRAAGRQRLYRLAAPEVASAIEALLPIAAPPRVVALRQSMAAERLRDARTCYDHLAGRLGVAVTEVLVARGMIREEAPLFRVTSRGERFFHRLGIDVPALRAGRRALGRVCMDWTERRPHLAGSLGGALLDCFVGSSWVVRHRGDRSVQLTDRGRHAVGRLFGAGAVPT
jgi:DNA-binding transcriptional ArsR family regulator